MLNRPISNQQKLVNLMEAKATICNKVAPGIKYFYKKDREELLALSNKNALYIIRKIRKNLRHTECDPQPFLSGDICPFCIIYFECKDVNCDECSYGNRHGICDGDTDHPQGGDSTWLRVSDEYNYCSSRLTKQELLDILKK